MKKIPLRRSQLVSTNGPGSLIVSPEGETAIVGALDYWFNKDNMANQSLEEFEVYEPRLKGFLGVNKLYTPPDYRDTNEGIPNAKITIPMLRFPLWHYCPFCKTMDKLEYGLRTSQVYCKVCDQRRYMKQVPFITICKQGHITDFPWMEWVHEGGFCKGKLSLNTSGGATLDSWKVKCSCGSERSLRGITAKRQNSSALTEELYADERKFICSGHKAWCGDEHEECNEPTVAILRNSINVYLPQKVSVISLPGEKNQNVDKLIDYLQGQKAIHRILSKITNFEDKVDTLYNALSVQGFAREDCEKTILYMSATDEELTEEGLSPMMLREKEGRILQSAQNENYLKVYEEWNQEEEDAVNYAGKYQNVISLVNRVTKLRETTALAGFKRLSSMDEEGNYTFKKSYDLMYQQQIDDNQKWLPAYSVFGEGIFIQFDLNEIKKWENDSNVQHYFQNYLKRIANMNHYMPEMIEGPRSMMVHSFAHLMIEEIANTSGYNMASIRERLYINENQVAVLIYTSAGDAEGTFGGLVRMGHKSKVFHLIDKALKKAYWCSSDPVCTELSKSTGQGLNNSNGAACYNCIYIPETSCECGNMYLDRSLVSDTEIGFLNLERYK